MNQLAAACLVLTAIALGGALPAHACTCPPEADAEAQASEYDFIGVVTVGEVFELKSEEEAAEAAAEKEHLNDYVDALIAYIEASAAGEDLPDFDTYMDEFYATSTYRPAPPSGSSLLTQMRVDRVLKGEQAGVIFVRSASPGMPACGVRYRPGSEVLLLAKGGDGLYSTWMCSQPQFPLSDFEAALAE